MLVYKNYMVEHNIVSIARCALLHLRKERVCLLWSILLKFQEICVRNEKSCTPKPEVT